MCNSIYLVTNMLNNKQYIGQTWDDVNNRWRSHCQTSKSNHCVKLKRAIHKYGAKAFKIDIIDQCIDQQAVDYLENLYIEKYDTIKNGYNLRSGGSHGKMSEETKKKMSKFQKSKIVSEKTKEKMRKPKSEEHKRAIAFAAMGNQKGKGNRGKKASKELRERFSIIRTGKKASQETKNKMSLQRKGRTWKVVDGKRVWSNK